MIPRGLIPILWGCGLILLGWLANAWVPPQYIYAFRLWTGFMLVAMMAWVILRVLRYERALTEHRAEILRLMARHEETRNQSVADLVQQTERIATDLAEKTVVRADALEKKLDVAIDATKLDSIEKKLDVVIDAKANDEHE